MENNSAGNSSSLEFLDELHILSTLLDLNAIQMSVGAIVLAVNLCFLCLLYYQRRNLHWKRYAFVANASAADCFAAMALIVLAAFAFVTAQNRNHQTALQLLILYGAFSSSLGVTTESYDALILVQYLAIRRPIWYKMLVTKRKILVLLIWIWTINPAYAFLKTYLLITDQEKHHRNLMVFDMSFLIVVCVWNTTVYLYVLTVAVRKKPLYSSSVRVSNQSFISHSFELTVNEHENHPSATHLATTAYQSTALTRQISRDQSQSISRNGSFYQQPNGRPRSTNPNRPSSNCANFLRHYRFLATAGLNLIAYWISVFPLITVYAYLLYSGQRFYFNEASFRHVAVLLWFVRSFCDPLIYMAREKKLRRWPKIERKDGCAISQLPKDCARKAKSEVLCPTNLQRMTLRTSSSDQCLSYNCSPFNDTVIVI